VCSIQPFDRWGFRQNLDGDDEEAFLSMAKKMDRRSEQLKVNKTAAGQLDKLGGKRELSPPTPVPYLLPPGSFSFPSLQLFRFEKERKTEMYLYLSLPLKP